MVSVGTIPPLVHVVEALHTTVLFLGHQVSFKSATWLATKAHHEGIRQAPLVTLMLSPLRSFYTKGVSTSPAQSVIATPHQVGGSKTIASEPLRPQDFRRTLYNLIHSKITSQGSHTLQSLNSKLSLALNTHNACASMDEQFST
jgi:hypothetical protein